MGSRDSRGFAIIGKVNCKKPRYAANGICGVDGSIVTTEETNGAVVDRRSINRIRRSPNEMSDRTYPRRNERRRKSGSDRWRDELAKLLPSRFIIHPTHRVLPLILSDFDLAIADFVIPTFRRDFHASSFRGH